jgi:hypothetical protein
MMKGEGHANSKLTTDQVMEIRKLYDQGESSPVIARKFDVCQVTISDIVTNKTWSHIGKHTQNMPLPTPGEWVVLPQKPKSKKPVCIGTKGIDGFVVVATIQGDRSSRRRIANATLICAAPKLLESAELLLKATKQCDPMLVEKAMSELRKAIGVAKVN